MLIDFGSTLLELAILTSLAQFLLIPPGLRKDFPAGLHASCMAMPSVSQVNQLADCVINAAVAVSSVTTKSSAAGCVGHSAHPSPAAMVEAK